MVPSKCKCDICGLQFKSAIRLEKHTSLMHQIKKVDTEPFTCSGCNKSFQTLAEYRINCCTMDNEGRVLEERKCCMCISSKRHTCEKSYKNRALDDFSFMKPVHLFTFKSRKPRKSIKEKPQRILLSPLTEVSKPYFPFKCDVCEKRFKYKIDVYKHKCLPTLNCEECGSAFTDEVYLKWHKIQVHADHSGLNE